MLRSIHAWAAAAALGVTPLAAEQAIVVLDASGSMWGQIEGRTKIELARETLGNVLEGAPDNLSLGLIAYGHRRKGDCDDIELLVPPGPDAAAAIRRAAEALRPKGKTPLSAAVVQAARALRYEEEKAAVILITDGLETCGFDPCETAVELAQSGVDFVTHVVGFGLSEQEGREVACLAENTGGLYLAADDAEQLGEALDHAVATAVEAPPVSESEPKAEPLPEVVLSAPESVEQAARFDVEWDGPAHRHDAIQIFDPAARNGEGRVLRSFTVGHGDMAARRVRLTAPARLGEFELRYLSGEHRQVLATRPIRVTETRVALSAPEQVEIGRNIRVEWIGPGAKYDAVQIFDPRAHQGDGRVLRDRRLHHGAPERQEVTLAAPATPGIYQLRYWNGENRAVLAQRPIEVVEAELALLAPERVQAGHNVAVEWVGPGGKYDSVQIFQPDAGYDEGRVLRNKRLSHGDYEARRLTLPAPAETGTYELRYWNGDYKRVLITRTLEVVPTELALEAPEQVTAGGRITVEWAGPGAKYDGVQLFDPAARGGDGKVLREARLRHGDYSARRVVLAAPAEAGTYQLRYWNGDNRKVLISREIQVAPAQVALSAPERIAQAHSIRVQWQGPGARYDSVQLFDPEMNAGAGKVLRERRLNHGDYDGRIAELPAPAREGTYQLRYWNGENRAVMATRDIEVVTTEVALKAPEQVTVDSVFEVEWVGPGARYDDLEIVDGNGKRVVAKRLRQAQRESGKARLKAPKQPGDFRLRYWNGENKAVMESRPLQVVE